MKVEFTPGDTLDRHEAQIPFPQAQYVIVPTLECSHCKAKPLEVAGTKGTQHTAHETITSDAQCKECLKHQGRIIVTMSTIFGIEEDYRVTNGPWKVF